jgi:vitamin B12 transporter
MKPSKFIFLLSLVGIACGADQNIRGVLQDPSGSPVPGARVECGGKAITSGQDGRFEFPGASRCAARVTAAGFETKQLILVAGSETSVPLAMAGVSERIVVSATRSETTVEEAGVAASVLTRSNLEQRDYPMVLDALRELPGMSVVQTGRRGAQTSVFTRGAESTGTLVLLDGVPMNDPGGEINFGNLTSSAVDRIEVVRGPESALFGAEASAGVIQMFTRRGNPESNTPHASVSYERGSYQTDRWVASLTGGGAGGRFDYSLNTEQSHTTGEYTNDFSRNTTGTANLGFRLSPATEIRGLVQSFDSHLGTPGEVGYGVVDLDANQESRDYVASVRVNDVRSQHFVQHASFDFHRLRDYYVDNGLGGPYQVAALVRDQATPQARTYLVRLLDPNNLPSASTLAANQRIVSMTDYLWASDPYESLTSRKHAEYQGTLTHSTGSLVGGYEYERQDGDLSGYQVSRDNHGIFLHEQQRVGQRLFLAGGIRAEHSSAFGYKVAPRGAASYRLVGEHGVFSSTYLRTSAGRGITEPSLLQNFAKSDWYAGNPNLRPEKTASYEAGLVQEWLGRRVRSEVAFFDNSFKDLITFVTLPNPPYGSWANVEASRARGLEFSSRARVNKYITAGAAYTRLWTRIITSNSPTSQVTGVGQELARRPRNSGSLWLAASTKRWGFQTGGIMVGERQDTDILGITRNAGYQTMYAGGSYKLNRHVTPYLRIENLLDARYCEVLGYPAPARHIAGGMRLEW